MNYTVELSNTAEQDIHESVRYVTLQLKNPIAGRRLLGNTIDCVDSLESFPARFPVIDDPILVIHQIHFVPVQNYLLFYQIHEPSHTVMVLRFLYGKSDWASILKKGPALQLSRAPRETGEFSHLSSV